MDLNRAFLSCDWFKLPWGMPETALKLPFLGVKSAPKPINTCASSYFIDSKLGSTSDSYDAGNFGQKIVALQDLTSLCVCFSTVLPNPAVLSWCKRLHKVWREIVRGNDRRRSFDLLPIRSNYWRSIGRHSWLYLDADCQSVVVSWRRSRGRRWPCLNRVNF